MNTPICDFVESYAQKNLIRAHIPGHKGKGLSGLENLDITEIVGADGLFCPDGIIAESERNAASVFGSARTVYSTEGSTFSIKAMLYLTERYAVETAKNKLVFAVRNAHSSFIAGAVQNGLKVEWIVGDGNLLTQNVTPGDVDAALKQAEQKPVAVYVTSPDYLGHIADVAGIKKVCERYGVLLIVDNAHGAYLKFLSRDIHPITLGADMCADSAHKTLPCLGGGGYLHLNHSVYEVIGGYLPMAYSLFASTSPSYLILRSLDKLNPYLDGEYSFDLKRLVEKLDEIKQKLKDKYVLVGEEPLKLTVDFKPYGYTGVEASGYLYEKGLVVEYADDDNVVMMFSTNTALDGLEKVYSILNEMPKKPAISRFSPKIALPERVMDVRDALLYPSETVSLSEAVGRVFGANAVSCPPAVPVLYAGELIGEKEKALLEYYGGKKLRVVK